MTTDNVVKLHSGAVVVFFTLYEYQLKTGDMVEPHRTNRGNFVSKQVAMEEKKQLEKTLPKQWQQDSEGRFTGPNCRTRWFHTKQRRFDIR